MSSTPMTPGQAAFEEWNATVNPSGGIPWDRVGMQVGWENIAQAAIDANKFFNPKEDDVCMDCGERDVQLTKSLTLARKDWLQICPEEGFPEEGYDLPPHNLSGVLCATCIVKRAHKLRGVWCVQARFLTEEELDKNGTTSPTNLDADPARKELLNLVKEYEVECSQIYNSWSSKKGTVWSTQITAIFHLNNRARAAHAEADRAKSCGGGE